ncbi:hypothetical protein GF407_01940 [candidate division KSB1 bacterium]|nr:hypothetical protein [candidate division KSB1 bacterium]
MKKTVIGCLCFWIFNTSYANYDPWQTFQAFKDFGIPDYPEQSNAFGARRFYAANYAWFERDHLNALLDAYLLSGKAIYINTAISRMQRMLSNLDSHLNVRSYLAAKNSPWSSVNIDTGKAYPIWRNIHKFSATDTIQGHVLSAYIMNPMARLCYLAGRYALADEYQPVIAGLADSLHTIMSHLDQWAYKENNRFAYYIDYPPDLITAWNYMTQAALVHFYLAQSGFLSARDSISHYQKAEKLGRYFKSQLINVDEHYIWKYYPNERQIKEFPAEPFWFEDVSHSTSDIEMVGVFYAHDLVFNETDIERFNHTLADYILTKNNSVNAYVTGYAGYNIEKGKKRFWRQFKANTRKNINALGNWTLIAAQNDNKMDTCERIYKAGEVVSKIKYPGTADLHFMAKVALMLFPKNFNFNIKNKADKMPAFWNPVGKEQLFPDSMQNPDLTVLQKKVKTAYAGLTQTIPGLSGIRYRLTLHAHPMPDTESSSTAFYLGTEESKGENEPVYKKITPDKNKTTLLWQTATSRSINIALFCQPGFSGQVRLHKIDVTLSPQQENIIQ